MNLNRQLGIRGHLFWSMPMAPGLHEQACGVATLTGGSECDSPLAVAPVHFPARGLAAVELAQCQLPRHWLDLIPHPPENALMSKTLSHRGSSLPRRLPQLLLIDTQSSHETSITDCEGVVKVSGTLDYIFGVEA